MEDIDQAVEEKEEVEIGEVDAVDGEEEVIPNWARDEDPEEEDTTPGEETVPVAKLASIREKLKKKLSKKEADYAELQAENERLRNSGTQQQNQQPVKIERPAWPIEMDYDTTDEYRAAMSDYHDKKDRYDDQMSRDRQGRVSQEADQRMKAEKFTKSIEDAYDSHIDRASRLLLDNPKIDADRYHKANENFMDAITRNLPAQSRGMGAKDVIRRLGPASAQIAYKFGNNPAYRSKLEGWIQEDPTCLTLMMRLGAEASKINEPVSRKSKAHAPASEARGGSTGTNGEAKIFKKYLALRETDLQAAIDLKEDAKKKGMDVKSWAKK